MAIPKTPSLNASMRLVDIERASSQADGADLLRDAGRVAGLAEDNHATERELLVGFHKRATGRASITWPESVDQALCFGWIDGVRRSLGSEGYTIRFTPRKQRSIWSAVNVRADARADRRGPRSTLPGCAPSNAAATTGPAIYSDERRQTAQLPDDYARRRARSRPPRRSSTPSRRGIGARRRTPRDQRQASRDARAPADGS